MKLKIVHTVNYLFNVGLIIMMDVSHCIIFLRCQSGDAWSLDGHVHFLRGEKEEARVSYERVLSFSPPSPQMHAIYLRLASIYLAEGRVRSIAPFNLPFKEYIGSCFKFGGEMAERKQLICNYIPPTPFHFCDRNVKYIINSRPHLLSRLL